MEYPPPDGHGQFHWWYQNQQIAEGYSCCNSQDCEPADDYIQVRGGWVFILKSGQSVFVPEKRISYKTPDGQAHFCGYPQWDNGVYHIRPRCGFIPSFM